MAPLWLQWLGRVFYKAITNSSSNKRYRGMKKGDLSKFVEDAVKWRVLDQIMAEARAGFADMPPDAVEALAGEAVAAVRHARKTPSPKAR